MAKLYTCEQVADRYGVKTTTVWDWIRTGKIKAIKLVKGYRITDAALEEFEQGENKKGD